jgi:hypothetical protein
MHHIDRYLNKPGRWEAWCSCGHVEFAHTRHGAEEKQGLHQQEERMSAQRITLTSATTGSEVNITPATVIKTVATNHGCWVFVMLGKTSFQYDVKESKDAVDAMLAQHNAEATLPGTTEV